MPNTAIISPIHANIPISLLSLRQPCFAPFVEIPTLNFLSNSTCFQKKWAPLAGHACAETRHIYDQCEYEDFLMRVKEYERERRLLMRKRRKELAVATTRE